MIYISVSPQPNNFSEVLGCKFVPNLWYYEREERERWRRRDEGERAPGRQKRKEEVGFILVLKEQAFPMCVMVKVIAHHGSA